MAELQGGSSNGNGASAASPTSATSEVSQDGSDPFGSASADELPEAAGGTDWSKSYHGLSVQPFPKEVADILLAPIDPLDVEIKPGTCAVLPDIPAIATNCVPVSEDGLLYLPEIKYRRVLNRAFGPGGWGLAPRSETNVGPRIVSREYALVCLGRLVGVARGEQEYFDPSGIPTATEAVKSNALMRCCKDLGIASELWYVDHDHFASSPLNESCRDPRFIREFKAKHCVEVFVEHVPTKKKCVRSAASSLCLLTHSTGRNFGGARTSPSLTILTKSRFGLLPLSLFCSWSILHGIMHTLAHLNVVTFRALADVRLPRKKHGTCGKAS